MYLGAEAVFHQSVSPDGLNESIKESCNKAVGVNGNVACTGTGYPAQQLIGALKANMCQQKLFTLNPKHQKTSLIVRRCWTNQIPTGTVAVVDTVLQLNTIRSVQLLTNIRLYYR